MTSNRKQHYYPKRIQDWKKIKVEIKKGKLIIEAYPNDQQSQTEEINLCRSKTGQ